MQDAAGARARRPQAKALHGDDIVRALRKLVITHDESLRELGADHHKTFTLPECSSLSTALTTAGDGYHEATKEKGPEHSLGPPTAYLLMALVAELQTKSDTLPRAQDAAKKTARRPSTRWKAGWRPLLLTTGRT